MEETVKKHILDFLGDRCLVNLYGGFAVDLTDYQAVCRRFAFEIDAKRFLSDWFYEHVSGRITQEDSGEWVTAHAKTSSLRDALESLFPYAGIRYFKENCLCLTTTPFTNIYALNLTSFEETVIHFNEYPIHLSRISATQELCRYYNDHLKDICAYQFCALDAYEKQYAAWAAAISGNTQMEPQVYFGFADDGDDAPWKEECFTSWLSAAQAKRYIEKQTPSPKPTEPTDTNSQRTERPQTVTINVNLYECDRLVEI